MRRRRRGTAKKNRAARRSGPVCGCLAGLEAYDVGGLQALGALHHLELHDLTFFQAPVPIPLDGREVDEHILPALPTLPALAELSWRRFPQLLAAVSSTTLAERCSSFQLP